MSGQHRQEDNLLQTYETLHALAEPSGREEKTSAYLQERLKESGFEVHAFPNHFGFYADWPGISEDVIALRSDMDALMQEVDGVVKPNHSCGHDAHSAMVLHTALRIASAENAYRHTVRFIFQPAEEIAAGALQMMDSGVLSRVRFLAGIHLRPEQEVLNGRAAPVILHGAIVTLKAIVRGTPAHAARPEFGNNPIYAAGALLEKLKEVKIDSPYSFKVTEFQAGEASNLIPETARVTFDVRAVKNEELDQLMVQAETKMKQIEQMTHTHIKWEWVEFSPASRKNERAVRLAKEAIARAVSEEAVAPPCVSPGAEDFHFYTYYNKELTATMIGLGCGLKPGLHHPRMTFDKEALHSGVDILHALLMEADQMEGNDC